MEATIVSTRDEVMAKINESDDEQFNKVAECVKSISGKDTVATANEVTALTKEFNVKYKKTFRALAQ